eukprot:Skav208428  [mRNA]  locus=scaffold2953:502745:513428:+ [translate_table: standard]
MGIGRDSRHKHYKTGGRSKTSIKKRKKYRALRLDAGNYAWGSDTWWVRTKTLLKNTVVQIDAHPFMQWYLKILGATLRTPCLVRKYGVDVGKKKKGAKEAEKEEEQKRSRHVIFKQKARAAKTKLDAGLEDQILGERWFQSGRLLACIASRPGQCGRADGYILEGEDDVVLRGPKSVVVATGNQTPAAELGVGGLEFPAPSSRECWTKELAFYKKKLEKKKKN